MVFCYSSLHKRKIPSVDGPSAGALMTLLVISAIEKKELKNNVTLTGTIDQYGHVGAIGGVVEKAKAANDSGKTLFLLPRENSQLVQYTEKQRNIGGITIIEQTPETSDAMQYIEANMGINVEYVDNIDDVLNMPRKPFSTESCYVWRIGANSGPLFHFFGIDFKKFLNSPSAMCSRKCAARIIH